MRRAAGLVACGLAAPGVGAGGACTVAAAHGAPLAAAVGAQQVAGFVLNGTDLPTVYVSGDNASLEVVRGIAERVGPVDTAILFTGAARTPFFDGALVTLDGALAAEAARILGARKVVPVHCDSWGHFTEGRDEVVSAFAAAGIADRLQLGQAVSPTAAARGVGHGAGLSQRPGER